MARKRPCRECGKWFQPNARAGKRQRSKAQDLFDATYKSLADHSSRALLDRLMRVELLLIDEMGYLNLRPEQSNIFFKLMEERYGKKTTIQRAPHRPFGARAARFISVGLLRRNPRDRDPEPGHFSRAIPGHFYQAVKCATAVMIEAAFRSPFTSE